MDKTDTVPTCSADVRDPLGITSGCLNKARPGHDFCGVHLRKMAREQARKPADPFAAGPGESGTYVGTLDDQIAKDRQDLIKRDLFLLDRLDLDKLRARIPAMEMRGLLELRFILEECQVPPARKGWKRKSITVVTTAWK